MKSPTARESKADAPVLIGIDVGTSSVRAIAFDLVGHRIAAASRPTPITQVATGGEYDPDGVFEAVGAVLRRVASALAGRPVAAVAVASIGESCVLVDDMGRPVAPSIAWFDRRAASAAADIATRIEESRVFAITGHDIDPIFTLFKLVWMRSHWPDAMARVRRIFMMADWVAFRLSGEAATDPGLASRTLYFDIGERRWSEEMTALAGVNPGLLSPIAASGTALGPVRPDVLAETGLSGAPIVAVGGHDHILGACVVGLARPGVLVNSIGTAESMAMSLPKPLGDSEVLRRGYVQGPMPDAGQRVYLNGSLYSSGGTMDWLRSIVGDVAQSSLVEEAAEVPVGSGGVTFLPHLGNGPPPNPDENARGAFFGLTTSVTRAVLYRSVLEGLALQSRLMMDGMVSLPGVEPPDEIRLIGGGSRNAFFLRIKANVFGRPLIVVEEAEATTLGAALLGGVAAGIYADLAAAVGTLERREDVIEPDASTERYEYLRTAVFAPVCDLVRPIDRIVAEWSL